MKNIKYFPLIILLLVLSSCLKEHNELVPELEGIPAGGMTGVTIKSVSDDVVTLEMSLFVVDHFGGFVTGLKADDFSVSETGSNNNVEIVGLRESEAEEKGPFSATLLFDQSGSIRGNDPNDARIEAGNSFANLVGSGDEGSIAAFSQGGNYFQSPYEVLTNFTMDKDQLAIAIENLRGKTGGYTPLYISVFDMIPYTKSNGANENKAIIAFTDGEDTEGGVSTESIIQAACANGVNVYTVGLGNSVNTQVLSKIAFETGGAVMLAEDAIQLVALYSSLGDLLHGQGRFYHLQMEVRRSGGGQWGLNDLVSGLISLPLSDLITINFPFTTYLGLEDIGEWHEKLPACPCTYDDAQDLLLSVCTGGEWIDCFNASQEFHYGAKKEIRWVPDETGKPGQQCTYDDQGMLITGGIAAGSPDFVSPLQCGFYEWLADVLYGDGNLEPAAAYIGHKTADMDTWYDKPCYEYLRDWPANTGDNCTSNNSVTGIQHLLNVVGEMNCEEVTLLFKTIDSNLGENHNLRKFFHQQINFYSPAQILSDLNTLSDDLSCGIIFTSDECDVIQLAIDNLE